MRLVCAQFVVLYTVIGPLVVHGMVFPIVVLGYKLATQYRVNVVWAQRYVVPRRFWAVVRVVILVFRYVSYRVRV